jgi:hypothetical protein
VERNIGGRTKARNVPRVRWNLGLDKCDADHSSWLPSVK